ncbi:methyltransferase domain-containing protein [Cyanobium sp. Maggiore-St4-Cus]|uniref:class I SAM-dependent methyltransferase n=1 Tax=Cyanobium sp. Maggiore-St4-Cus TaxID=2823717 RepID=UPI0020CF0303|nr:class I SAM-dependent methyltransferase [Cyanobium sp. Maggiore-St4-Cus]MCP9787669.1 methyltransferase domain-containing protein [Cyanobium sp. Maggiore-St4-Cus]
MPVDTTNQLALHNARKSQLDRSSLYIETFLAGLDPMGDHARVACPTCHHQPDGPLFKKRKGEYAHCPQCDHIFLLNPLAPEKLISFYTNYPTSSLEWHQNESDFYRRIYQRGIKLFSPHCSGSRLLDIGCSSGYFLSIAAQEGLDAFGIEPNAQEARYAVTNGIKVIGSTIDDLSPDEQGFDVISLWDVLEHIREPVSYVANLRNLLSNKGLVFVQVPTSDSLAARILRDDCNMFDGIEHLTLFSSRSLDIAFDKAGFSCLVKQSVISEVHAIRNYLSYQADPYIATPVSPFEAAFLDADSLENSGLGYKIQAVYRLNP